MPPTHPEAIRTRQDGWEFEIRKSEFGMPPTHPEPIRSWGEGWEFRIQNSELRIQKVVARYELRTTVIEESGIRIAARIGLMWPVIAKLTATTL